MGSGFVLLKGGTFSVEVPSEGIEKIEKKDRSLHRELKLEVERDVGRYKLRQAVPPVDMCYMS